MTTYLDPQALAREAIETLRLLSMDDAATDSSRVAAAKALLERTAPKADEEALLREKEERDAALIEAKNLLAAFTAAKLAGFYQPDEMAADGAARTDNAQPAQGLARLADPGGPGLGQDTDRG